MAAVDRAKTNMVRWCAATRTTEEVTETAILAAAVVRGVEVPTEFIEEALPVVAAAANEVQAMEEAVVAEDALSGAHDEVDLQIAREEARTGILTDGGVVSELAMSAGRQKAVRIRGAQRDAIT